jgi:hypothetical protein
MWLGNVIATRNKKINMTTSGILNRLNEVRQKFGGGGGRIFGKEYESKHLYRKVRMENYVIQPRCRVT